MALHPQDGPHVDLRVVVDDDRVVMKIEMNFVFLDAMVDLDREDPARISAEEWAVVPGILEDHFLNLEIVRIDGTLVYPELENLQLNDPDLRLLPLFPVSKVSVVLHRLGQDHMHKNTHLFDRSAY